MENQMENQQIKDQGKSKPVKNVLLISISVFLITACTNKQYQRVEHEKVKTDNSEPELIVKSTTLKPSNIKANEKLIQEMTQEMTSPQEGRASVMQESSVETLMDQVVKPLMTLLFVDKLHDRTYSRSIEATQALSQLNRSLLLVGELINSKKLTISAEVSSDYEKTLVQYNRVLLDGCIGDTLKGCKSYSLLRSDYNTTKVIQLMIFDLDKKIQVQQVVEVSNEISCTQGCAKTLKEYYRLIFYAYDLKNSVLDKNLELYYIKRAKMYGKLLSSEAGQRKNLVRHGQVFQLIVNKYEVSSSGSTEEDKKFLKFLHYFSPWTYSVKSKDIFQKASQGLFRKATVLYKTDPTLKETLIDAVKLSQTEEGSFLKELEEIRNKNPKILEKLSLNRNMFSKESINNEYFFLVDRLFTENHSLDESNALWAGIVDTSTRLKQENQLTDVIHAYLKIELAKRVIKTNEFMREIFSSEEAVGGQFVQKVLDESLKELPEWETFLKKAEKLLIFTGQSFHQIEESESYASLKKFEQSLKININYLSVYPNMMMLVYYMKKTRSELEIRTWFGIYKVISSQIIQALLDSKISPWFNFGNENVTIGSAGILMSAYYLVATDLFKTYSELNNNGDTNSGKDKVDINFSTTDFYQTMLEGYIQDTQTEIQTLRDDLQEDMRKGKGIFTQAENICAKPKADPITPVSLNFSNIEGYVFLGKTSGKVDSPLEVVEGYMPTIYRIQETRETLNKNLAVIDVMVKTLTEQNTSAILDENKETQEKINAEIKKIKEERKDLISEYAQNFVMLDECFQRLNDIETQRSHQLLLEEADYLREIHKYMTQLRSDSAAQPDPSLFDYKIGYTIVGDDGESRPIIGKITGNEFHYSYYDNLLRMRWRLEKKNWASVIMPTSEAIRGSDYYKNKKRTVVKWHKDVEEFVRQAMLVHATDGAVLFTNWVREASKSVDYWVEYRELLFQLYLEDGLSGELAEYFNEQSSDPELDTGTLLLRKILENEMRIWNHYKIVEGSTTEAILKIIGKNAFYDQGDLEEQIYTASKDPRAFMDHFYTFFESSHLPIEGARDFFDSMSQKSNLIFPLTDGFVCKSVDVYESQMEQRFAKRKKAENYFKTQITNEFLKDSNLDSIRTTLASGSESDSFNIKMIKNGRPAIVSENLKDIEINFEEEVRAYQKDFYRHTKACHSVDQTRPDQK